MSLINYEKDEMELKEAKQKMKEYREVIKKLKEDRILISDIINARKKDIMNIKGAIFRGEIK